MNTRDEQLIWEAICGKPVQQRLDEEGLTSEQSGTFNAKRGETKGMLAGLSSWVEAADGDDLDRAYEHILKAYQIAGYPDTSSGEDEIPRGGRDEIDDGPIVRPTDQEKYGYEGDR